MRHLPALAVQALCVVPSCVAFWQASTPAYIRRCGVPTALPVVTSHDAHAQPRHRPANNSTMESPSLQKPSISPEHTAKLKLPKKSAALVVHKGMTDKDTSALLQEVLERLNMAEKDLKQMKKKMGENGIEVPSGKGRSRKFVIDKRATKIGSAVAGGFGGMLLGWSVFVNLWLLGAVAGAAACALLCTTDGPVGSFISEIGMQVALVYKDIKDFYDQTVFLYKTGKLSYQYWSMWDDYDRRFQLTAKYNGFMARVSKEAYEIDRQYKIRNKALGIWGSTSRSVRVIGGAAGEGALKVLRNATGFGDRMLDEMQYQQDHPPRWGKSSRGRQWQAGSRRQSKQGGGGFLASLFPHSKPVWRGSPYSPPPRGHSYPPSVKGAWQQLLMTPAERRLERMKRERVKFMGWRDPQ
eukprot:TRINITY_DN12205_c0_g1_i1.p1 TRINITY_DN12205_c0_g1~~TRINITY_DN12205_c0_g1_i1.p1  ORF type:complete len:410 (+),score=68.16 TRINITY_DN12205_c0_g1_i1:194-1423(+)